MTMSTNPDPDPEPPEWIPEITQWWVTHRGVLRTGDVVHLPASVDTQTAGDPTDPRVKPDANPLCHTTTTQSWRVKSLAVLPLGWKPVCKLCLRAAEDLCEAGRL